MGCSVRLDPVDNAVILEVFTGPQGYCQFLKIDGWLVTSATATNRRRGRLPVLLLCLHVNVSKNSFSLADGKLLAESGCKSTTFPPTNQIFHAFFSQKHENFREYWHKSRFRRPENMFYNIKNIVLTQKQSFWHRDKWAYFSDTGTDGHNYI